MKIRSLFLLVALFQMYKIYGQTPVCTPNQMFKDSAAGIYPKPYNDSTKLGGISQVACIDMSYEVPLTVNIPDSVTVSFLGSNITLALESAKMDTSKAVVGLPKGLKYYCAPGTCVFEKKKLGCIVIKGTPTADNKLGNYDLLINLTLVTSFGSIDVTFPGTIFPGKYFITVAAKGSNKCLTSDIHSIQAFQGSIHAYPNPVRNQMSMHIEAEIAGKSELIVSDLMGNKVMRKELNLLRGVNDYSISIDPLVSGIYYYTLSKDKYSTTKKMIVLRE